MDDPALDPSAHLRALAGLARINHLSGADRVLWHAIRRHCAGRRMAELRVLDVATGAGDVPARLCRRALRAGVRLTLTLCDVSERALERARMRAAATGVDVTAQRRDAVAEPLPTGFDIALCSLFLHHLN